MVRESKAPQVQFIFGSTCDKKENSCGNTLASDGRMSSKNRQQDVINSQYFNIDSNVKKRQKYSNATAIGADIVKAKELFRACPEGKRFIWRYCLNEVYHQRHYSKKTAIEQARRKDWTAYDGNPFKLNNSLSPAIARLFLLEHPEARPYIELRHSKCDGGAI